MAEFAFYLKYPVSFEGEYRKVELLEKLIFQYKRIMDGNSWIDVGKGIELGVLGTEFNVDAYPDTTVLAATLVTGR